jgi:hypothetical protein
MRNFNWLPFTSSDHLFQSFLNLLHLVGLQSCRNCGGKVVTSYHSEKWVTRLFIVQPTNQLCNTSWIRISTETSPSMPAEPGPGRPGAAPASLATLRWHPITASVLVRAASGVARNIRGSPAAHVAEAEISPSP